MASDDKEPRSTMSRSKGHGQVVTGGRSIKYRRWPTSHKETWPVNPESEAKTENEPSPANKRRKTLRVPKGSSIDKSHGVGGAEGQTQGRRPGGSSRF